MLHVKLVFKAAYFEHILLLISNQKFYEGNNAMGLDYMLSSKISCKCSHVYCILEDLGDFLRVILGILIFTF